MSRFWSSSNCSGKHYRATAASLSTAARRFRESEMAPAASEQAAKLTSEATRFALLPLRRPSDEITDPNRLLERTNRADWRRIVLSLADHKRRGFVLTC